MTPTDTSPSSDAELQIDNWLDEGYFERNLRKDVSEGLRATFKSLPPKWFYDDVGSQLFDEITRLEEYYPTEAERSILKDRAADIAAASGADTLVELGSGTADKTRVLLTAMRHSGQLVRFIPFDVSEGILRSSAAELLEEYPGLLIHGVVGDFEHHLTRIPRVGKRMTALLGGTVGNFEPNARKAFLADVVSRMNPGDTFLLGTDLVKDRTRLVNAYDDSKGVTAAFNKNVLSVLNKRLDADFDLDAFDHFAFFDEENEWMDIRLRSNRDQHVRIAGLDMDVHFARGEEMRTEISAKFRKEGITAELAEAGLDLTHWMTDANGDYALSLSVLR